MGLALNRTAPIATLTADYIRKYYLLGLSFVDANNKPYDDAFYAQKLSIAISQFEQYTNVTVRETPIVNEAHDYHAQDYEQFAFIQLFQYPVIQGSVQVAGQYPNGQTVTTFPKEWVRLDQAHGQVQLVPTAGTIAQVLIGQGGNYLPSLYGTLSYLPQFFQASYTAGFPQDKVPTLFIDAIAKLATIETLSVFGDTIYPPGVTSQSLGTDGLSSSRSVVNNGEYAPVFSGRIKQYKRDLFGDPQLGINGVINDIKEYYHGMTMAVM